MNDLQERWAEVGRRLSERMRDLTLTAEQLADLAGYSTETIRPLYRGKVNSVRPATRAAVAKAVGWTPGSIDLILQGELPVYADPSEDVDVRALIAELLTRVNKLELALGGDVEVQRLALRHLNGPALRAADTGDDPGPRRPKTRRPAPPPADDAE